MRVRVWVAFELDPELMQPRVSPCSQDCGGELPWTSLFPIALQGLRDLLGQFPLGEPLAIRLDIPRLKPLP